MYHFLDRPIQFLSASSINDFNMNELAANFTQWVDDMDACDSGWTFIKIKNLTLEIAVSNSIRGNSYIKLPFESKSILNIINLKDNDCIL